MEYRKFGSDYVVRMDRGEEILACVEEVCKKEQIRLGSLNGLGAVGAADLGVFDTNEFRYRTETYEGDYEIASCMGNISTMDGKTYLHVHAVIANSAEGEVHGGHLSRGVISLTGEFVIHAIDGEVDRKYSDEVGLNLIRFLS